MTTIDSIDTIAPAARGPFGRFVSGVVAALLSVLRVISDEIVYMLREDGDHGRIESGKDDTY